MASKPLTSEAIALTEKKMDMTLDEIIKMSKSNTAKPNKQSVSNKNQRFSTRNQDKTQKMQLYMNSRSTLRRGVLAQRRSSFQGNSFPLATEAARKVAVTPFHTRVFNHNKTVNWNKPRPGGSFRRQQQQQGNHSNGGNAQKDTKIVEALPKSKPKTLDSLFANMKEQRMRSPSTNNGGAKQSVSMRNQVRQPWLRGRFGIY